MKKINTNEMNALLKAHYKTKTPIYIGGTFGIGKSSVVKQSAQELAEEKEKEFVDWNNTTSEEKIKMLENPSKYFVFIDERLSQYEPSDLKGLPKFSDDDKKYQEWSLPVWLVYLSHKDADGILFFDEINLAPPSVLASCYQIFHDRTINAEKLSDNILIASAGNRASDKANVYDVPNPLRDRKSEFELILNNDEWYKWALKNGVDLSIVSFLKFREDYLFKVDDDRQSKPISPRGWERVSVILNSKPAENIKEMLIAGAIGDGVAREYTAFVKLQAKINLKELLEHPEKVKEIDGVDLNYSVVAGLSNLFKKSKHDNLEPLLHVCGNMNAEYGVLLLKFMVAIDKNHLKRHLPKSDFWVNELSKKYGSYLVG